MNHVAKWLRALLQLGVSVVSFILSECGRFFLVASVSSDCIAILDPVIGCPQDCTAMMQMISYSWVAK